MLFDDSAAVKVINFKTDASAQINDKDIAIDEYWLYFHSLNFPQ